jgi:hypothetical protein
VGGGRWAVGGGRWAVGGGEETLWGVAGVESASPQLGCASQEAAWTPTPATPPSVASHEEFRVARSRSAAGRGAIVATFAASTTPREDLGVPPRTRKNTRDRPLAPGSSLLATFSRNAILPESLPASSMIGFDQSSGH